MAIAPTLNIPQAKFLAMQYKFKAYVAGFGSGKTWVGCGGICKGMWEHPKINQGYFAPTYPQIRDIFYPTVEEVARDWGLNVKINEGNKEVHFYAGRQYRGTTICRSMEKPQTIVGFKIGNALIDELDVMPAKKAQLSGITYQVALYRQYRQVRYEVGLSWGVAAVKSAHSALLLG